jgi:hypothetical protein
VNPRYQFWMQAPGGLWSVVQAYSPLATYSWSTAGRPPGTYHFSVWSRDMNSRGPNGAGAYTYDSFGATDFVLTTSPCTATTVSAAPPSGGVIGNSVTITGAATGCPNPSYQFWMQPPGGGWSVVQPYSTSANFTWNTSGWGPGSYTFSVWARDASSLGTGGGGANTYDAFAALQYPLGRPACTPSTATPTPASPATIGTQVTVTATTSGCPNPRYQLWTQAPGGAWTVAQAYSPTASFGWSTAGWPPGTYNFSVWVRDAASASAYDSYSAFTYTLNRTPCTGMSASQQPPSPSKSGTTVTVTGAATGCPNAQYEFWMLAPGGTWTPVQSYSSSATFTWKTSGWAAGNYIFSVWARDASSPASYDAYSSFTYALS